MCAHKEIPKKLDFNLKKRLRGKPVAACDYLKGSYKGRTEKLLRNLVASGVQPSSR